MANTPFPSDFLWGVATSAYQIEGATLADGRGESVWDRFAQRPGAISDRSDGTFACEHYLRYADDVALMRDLGVGAYRFSVAWPRVLPVGRGVPNEAGLDFYDRLVDELLRAGIRPFVTLNHWDLPQALEDEGGWPVRSTADAFVEYADVVSRRLGDRVRDWTTHNEPWCVAHLGYATGEHAPGRKDLAASLRAVHHLLLSHGRAVPVLRANSPGAQVGIVLNLASPYAASPSAADRDATALFDARFNRWYLDPLYGRGYPREAIDSYAAEGVLDPSMPFVQEGDLAQIAAATDYLGLNYYSRAVIRASIPEAQNEPRTIPEPTAAQKTDMGWEVYPDGLRTLLLRVARDYTPARLYVTENGAAYANGPDEKGRVHDPERLEYLRSHVEVVRQAIEQGAPVGGYFAWSLLDNFEWQFGYERRFGIVWVDFTTQARIVKASGHWYREAILAHGLPESGPVASAVATPSDAAAGQR